MCLQRFMLPGKHLSLLLQLNLALTLKGTDVQQNKLYE